MGCIFAVWSKKKEEWLEREVYADVEKEQPDFGEGDLIRYLTQSNILVQYEILQKHAYEFEYEDDEDDEDDEPLRAEETSKENK